MYPSIWMGDRIFAFKLPFSLGYRFQPQRDEIYIFKHPKDQNLHTVKRVVGLSGDSIEIREKILYRNGKPMNYSELKNHNFEFEGKEFYRAFRESSPAGSHYVLLHKDSNADFGPFLVPKGKVFVLGDNRDVAEDSRYWGAVPIENLEARVISTFLSLDPTRESWLVEIPHIRWNRLFKAIR